LALRTEITVSGMWHHVIS